jgi:hypothetical protein
MNATWIKDSCIFKIPPVDNLWKFRSRDAADPKDKVLGLLGLSTDWSPFADDTDFYAMNTTQFYHYITRRIITTEKELKCLEGSEPHV